MSELSAIILTAGRGFLNFGTPKVLCKVLFTPMINWTVQALTEANIQNICAVAGLESKSITSVLDKNIEIFTGDDHAGILEDLTAAKEFLLDNQTGDVLVIYGDRPLMDSVTIENAYITHKKRENAVTVITTRLNDPWGYDRIVRDKSGAGRIVSQKDASESELLIKEVDAGAYWFRADCLLEALSGKTGEEFSMTHLLSVFTKKKFKEGIYSSENENIVLSADSSESLYELNQAANRHILSKLMSRGVEFLSTDGVLISNSVSIGKGTCILPGCILRGNTVIGENCVIGPNSLVEDTVISDRTKFNASQCYQSKIGADVTIGPFCHIRPNSLIKDGVHIGDFVEVKNSTVGEKTHISHLTYVGDSDVGKRVNFGCGVVTVNYNGKSKNRCVIGDNAFIGCNTNLVAPVKIGDNGYTAAGSTITQDVPDESLAIARARQTNKEGYNKKLRG